MITPNDKDMYDDQIDTYMLHGMKLGELIKALQEAQKKYGDDCVVMMSYDSGAGYDNIKSVFSQELYGILIINACCEYIEEVNDKVIDEF